MEWSDVDVTLDVVAPNHKKKKGVTQVFTIIPINQI